MQEFLTQIAVHHVYIVYIVILLLACIEGPIISMIAGVLIKLGFVSFIYVYITLMVGDVIADSFFYFLGHNFGHGFIRRFGKYFGVTEEGVAKMTVLFHRHKDSILFISKI